MNENMTMPKLSDGDYELLADFRYLLRQFTAFSESKAIAHGLTAQQHQALLAIRAAQPDKATIGFVAERLLLRPHSATGLIDRLEAQALVVRRASDFDRRQARIELTAKGQTTLADLSATHKDEIKRLRPLLKVLLDRVGE